MANVSEKPIYFVRLESKTEISKQQLAKILIDLKFCPFKEIVTILSPTLKKHEIEFNDPRVAETFVKFVAENKMKCGEILKVKLPVIPTQGIMLTGVPGSVPQETIIRKMFGKQKIRMISSTIEREMTPDGKPMWATGRRFYNVNQEDFEKIQNLPDEIEVAKNRKVKVKLQSKNRKCFKCNEPGHLAAQCPNETVLEPPQKSRNTNAKFIPKNQSTPHQKKRGRSTSGKRNVKGRNESDAEIGRNETENTDTESDSENDWQMPRKTFKKPWVKVPKFMYRKLHPTEWCFQSREVKATLLKEKMRQCESDPEIDFMYTSDENAEEWT